MASLFDDQNRQGSGSVLKSARVPGDRHRANRRSAASDSDRRINWPFRTLGPEGVLKRYKTLPQDQNRYFKVYPTDLEG